MCICTHTYDLSVRPHSLKRKIKHGNLLRNCPADIEEAVQQLVRKDRLGPRRVFWPSAGEPRLGDLKQVPHHIKAPGYHSEIALQRLTSSLCIELRKLRPEQESSDVL